VLEVRPRPPSPPPPRPPAPRLARPRRAWLPPLPFPLEGSTGLTAQQLRGVDVKFPFEAYPCQVKYMECVLEALQSSENALLESPTGTGKTLCLLSAALAWQEAELRAMEAARAAGLLPQAAAGRQVMPGDDRAPQQRPPTIVYASRTHSQLAKVVQELRLTPYRPPTVVLGSRQQLCVHDKVRQLSGAAQVYGCRNLTSRRMCAPHRKVQEHVKGLEGAGVDSSRRILDIEDLLQTGENGRGPCPYYLSRELGHTADLVLVPYNYVLDPRLRAGLAVEWKNCVMIFDEAHNIEDVCADAASVDCDPMMLPGWHSEISASLEPLLNQREQGNAEVDGPIEDRQFLKGLVLKLEGHVKNVAKNVGEAGRTYAGHHIYELLEGSGIKADETTLHLVLGQVRSAMEDLATARGTTLGKSGAAGAPNFRLQTLETLLRRILDSMKPAREAGGRERQRVESYRLHIAMEREAQSGELAPALHFWCFSSSLALSELKEEWGVRSMVLTSGTLSPMDSFASELALPFPVRLENPHVIDASQIFVGILPKGPAGRALNSTFRNRSDPGYLQDLGNSIANFARTVPDGLLIFFASFSAMETSLKAWEQPGPGGAPGIRDRILRHKEIVVEPRQSNRFSEACEEYRFKLANKSGAVFFAVCRGKLSEGLDFSDRAGRAVVVTGIPFPPLKDKRVNIKKQVLDMERAKGGAGLSGNEWYTQQATRAVNQALGRVIRHKGDYGAVLLCDERFASQTNQKQISAWMRPHIKACGSFGELVGSLTRFFRHVGESPFVLEAGASKRLREENRKKAGAPKKIESVFRAAGVRPALRDANALGRRAAGAPSQKFITQLQGSTGRSGGAAPLGTTTSAPGGRAPSLVEQLQKMRKPLPPAHGPVAPRGLVPAQSQAASSGAPAGAATRPVAAPRAAGVANLGELMRRAKCLVAGPTLALVVQEAKRLLNLQARLTEGDVAAACQAVANCGMDTVQLGAVHDIFREVAPARAWPEALRQGCED